MTLLKIVEPEVGTKNSVADPRIPAALKEIEKVVNGELEGTNNIKAGGILEANLATALLEKFTTKLGLKLEEKNESITGVSEHLYVMVKEASTLELPAPTLNSMIGVFCGSAIKAFKMKASSGKIYSPLHLAGATTVEVTTASTLVVMASGVNWIVIAGAELPEATTYKELLLHKAEGEAGIVLSATKSVHIVCEESGSYEVNVGGAIALPGETPKGTGFMIGPGQTFKITTAVAQRKFWYKILP